MIAPPPGPALDETVRHDVPLDAGDLVEPFEGQYATGPDVGTSSADMDSKTQTRKTATTPAAGVLSAGAALAGRGQLAEVRG